LPPQAENTISRLFISVLEAEKGLEESSMMVFVAKESKPGTVEKKPKHMNSDWCHQV
jgi:hypothetical protein